jgi:hypothetical protein
MYFWKPVFLSLIASVVSSSVMTAPVMAVIAAVGIRGNDSVADTAVLADAVYVTEVITGTVAVRIAGGISRRCILCFRGCISGFRVGHRANPLCPSGMVAVVGLGHTGRRTGQRQNQCKR